MDQNTSLEVEVQVRLARIETKLDDALRVGGDQEQRIRALERRDAYVLGISAAIALVAPLVMKKLFGF